MDEQKQTIAEETAVAEESAVTTAGGGYPFGRSRNRGKDGTGQENRQVR